MWLTWCYYLTSSNCELWIILQFVDYLHNHPLKPSWNHFDINLPVHVHSYLRLYSFLHNFHNLPLACGCLCEELACEWGIALAFFAIKPNIMLFPASMKVSASSNLTGWCEGRLGLFRSSTLLRNLKTYRKVEMVHESAFVSCADDQWEFFNTSRPKH